MIVKRGPKWPLWSQEWLFQIHVFIERRKGELKYLNHCFYKMILNECTSPYNKVGRFLNELKGRPSNLSIIMVIRSIPGSTVQAKPQREFPNDCKNDRCATCRSQIHPESFGIQWNEQKKSLEMENEARCSPATCSTFSRHDRTVRTTLRNSSNLQVTFQLCETKLLISNFWALNRRSHHLGVIALQLLWLLLLLTLTLLIL